ncbi:Hypothetical predicted protein [Pelobates cultripes]|uniref:Uncharacterized protein n=1 Tax=Pelobates cultripes TaxID=61616 RepID=A0AAD1SIL9_PELCU|nr:Hypothetical predicted protein [Pelobates cultripes]
MWPITVPGPPCGGAWSSGICLPKMVPHQRRGLGPGSPTWVPLLCIASSQGMLGAPDPRFHQTRTEAVPSQRCSPGNPALHRFVAGGWRKSRIRRPATLSGLNQSWARPKQVRGYVKESSSL